MKKTILSFVALLLTTFSLSACGKHEDLKYSFSENGCETGEQTADSTEEYCQKLADHDLNHGCATYMRKNQFTQSCGETGLKWPDENS